MRGWLPVLGTAFVLAGPARADDDRFARDPAAAALVTAMQKSGKHVITTGEPEIMDGHYRGKIKLVPQLPIGEHRKHLQWTHDAMATFDTFFATLFPAGTKPAYRWTELTFKFVRSPGKRTPSAYAMGWAITYNVNGSLLTTAPGVLETLWHEIFHTNDFGHGDWSAKTLQRDYDAIVRRCKTPACFAPYAPNTTKVRATGQYYAFQQNNGNGVHEYAAEIAVRYYREHQQMLRDGALAAPAYKCGPVENQRSWAALVAEFFGGVDLTPPCP